jgi:uncharacterized alkaline shock family protein YloU
VADNELRASLPDDRLGGDVIISDLVIAKLAGRAARRTYGVVGMRRSPAGALRRLFGGDELLEGVEVDVRDGSAHIGLHVSMERGLKLAEVRATLEGQVKFEVESVAGIQVAEVGVRVEDVRS